MSDKIERPANCGECAWMQKFHAIIDGVEYDGACPEFCTHVRNTDVCHPNVGMKKRRWTMESKCLVILPCTARELEDALHSYCDHHGAWDMRIMSDAISSGRSIQDTRITLALSEGSGESSPSPSSPTSSALVNSAAMREALEKCRDLAETIWQSESGEDVSAEIAELKDRIDAALAKPARNCDRFADELDAQLAFLNEVWLISIDRETMTEQDTYEKWTDEMRTRYGRWLYAPATEQKGETDGK